MGRLEAVGALLQIALLLPLIGCRTRLLDDAVGHSPNPPTSAPWPLSAHDPQWSNRGTTSGPSIAGVVWRSMDFDVTGNCVAAQPLVERDGTIYVIGNDGTLRSFTPDGQLRFESSFPMQVNAATAALGPDGTIYVGSLGPFGTTPIVALDSQSGKPRWTSSICRASLGFVGADGNIYGVCWPEGAANPGTSVFSLRPEDGSLRFRTDAPSAAVSLLQGIDGTLIAIMQQNRTATFDPIDGSVKLQLPQLQASCLEVSANGVLHCQDIADELDAMDVATGKILWRTADHYIPNGEVWAEGSAGQLYVIQQDKIGVYDAQGSLAEFASTTGWDFQLAPSLLLDGDGAVYFYGNTMQGTLLAIFEPTGATRFVTTLDDEGWFLGWFAASTLALGNGTLYGVTCRQSQPRCAVSPCHLVAFGSRP